MAIRSGSGSYFERMSLAALAKHRTGDWTDISIRRDFIWTIHTIVYRGNRGIEAELGIFD